MTPLKRNMITLSVRGDDTYRAAVRELARRQKVMVGDLVRQALDTTYGTELEDLLSFFANHRSTNAQTGKVVKPKEGKS